MGNYHKAKQRGIKGPRGIPLRSYLSIKCYTSLTTQYSLFDYFERKPDKEQVVITTSAIVLKEENEGKLTVESISHLADQLKQSLPSGIKFIVHRTPTKKGFVIQPIKINVNGSYLQKAVWSVIQEMPHKIYVIKEGDIIRIGWQRFKIKQLVFEKQTSERNNKQLNAKFTLYENLTKQNKITKKDKHGLDLSSVACCRICLDEGTKQDPLIPPCRCQGSMRYIHFRCLKDWLNKKLEYLNIKQCILINWKPLICELCRTSYMHQVYIDGKKYYTVDIPSPQRPYMVMQIISQDDQSKFYNVISFAKKSYQIVGRTEEADIYLPGCASVSQYHCMIHFNAETSQFIIFDESSRYGTLVFQKKAFQVNQQNPAVFQVGRNLFKIKMTKGQNEPLIQTQNKIHLQEDHQQNNVLVYEASANDSEQSYFEQQSIGEFTRPVNLLKVNVNSIRPFKSNLNESEFPPESDISQKIQEVILNQPNSRRSSFRRNGQQLGQDCQR